MFILFVKHYKAAIEIKKILASKSLCMLPMEVSEKTVVLRRSKHNAVLTLDQPCNLPLTSIDQPLMNH